MGKRFKNLNAALNYLRTPGTEDNPDAPANTPLKQYQDWRKGARNVTYTRDAASLPGELLPVALQPFGLALEDATLTRVPISKRAKEQVPGTGTLTAANISEDGATTAVTRIGFKPAQAVITVANGGATPQPIPSKITGVPYTPSNAKSYTLPYGKKTGVLLEVDVRAAILVALAGVAGVSVTFDSEKL